MIYAQCSFTVEGDNPISDYCFEASANLNYTLTGTPAGGTFSGDHVSSNTFSPPIVAFIGEFDITYTVDACSTTETITIGADFQLSGQSGSFFCIADAPFALEGNMAGGTFSGEDIIGGGFVPSEAGTYDITYMTSNGCTVSKTIEIGPSFTIEGINTDAGGFNICGGSLPATLVGSPAGGTFSGPGFLAGQFNPAVIPGTFNITYTHPTCGSVTETISVEGVAEDAIIDVAASNLAPQYCETDESIITPVGNLGASADFFINGSLIENFQISTLGAGTYELFYSFEDENGCNSLDAYTFNVFPQPNPDFDLPEQYCIAGEALSLMALSGVSGNSTFQGTGVTSTGSPMFDPTTAGLGTHVITHEIEDNIGLCRAEMSKEITVMPEVDASFGTIGSSECFTGEDILFYNGTSTGDDVAYFWNLIEGEAIIEVFLGGTTDTVQIFSDAQESESFTVELEVSNGGCSATAQQTFNQINLSLNILTPSQSIEAGQSVNIEAEANTTFGSEIDLQWQPSQGLSCSDCLTPVANPSVSTTYYLFAQNDSGCTIADSVRISVTSDIEVILPTAFSPNEDSINDRFQVIGRNIESAQLSIYSRWGEKIFEGDGLKGWDGFYDLRVVDMGVYLYVAEVVLLSGETVLQKGYVTVLK